MQHRRSKSSPKEYRWGFVTDIEADSAPPGLNEDIIRFISAKKEEPEWLLQWRLKAYRSWCKMAEPEWAKLGYDAIDFQKIIYYSAPKQKKKLSSLDEVDPTLLEAYEKLGIPLDEQKRLAGVAVDAVFRLGERDDHLQRDFSGSWCDLLLVLRSG